MQVIPVDSENNKSAEENKITKNSPEKIGADNSVAKSQVTEPKEISQISQSNNDYDSKHQNISESEKQKEQSVNVSETQLQKDMRMYVANIERKLKMNWDEPKDIGNNPVELKFKIGKDGSLISYNIYKSSGSTSADEAAVEALKRTAPFTPLPESFTGSSVDVLFTFDLKIFH